ncbi:CARDB domain-containing protein, partial [Hyalangium sp.]|uniref:CARDB domain-containing protein n=1 Tax=Hyalangium sp. TaxID=2028555 RepID=UPI002D6AC87A
YLGAVADPGHGELELIETNNTRASKIIGVGHGPDFIVQSVIGPASILPGQPFTVSVTVCNQGTTSGSTDAQLVLSQDTTIRFSYGGPPSSEDLPLYNFYTGPLQPGQCRTEQVETSAWAPDPGAWYLGVIADPGNYQPELVETNNTRASVLTGIGYAPDIIIQEVSTQASAMSGQPFTASVKVCNQGTESGPAEVQLVLSEDTDIRFSFQAPPNSEDFPAGFFSIPGGLQPGECRTEQAEVHGWVPHEGTWHLGAVADAGNYTPELIETNNTGVSDPIGIGYGADYIIQAVTVPASVMPGQQLTASVTVCNQGTTGGSTDVQLVLSEDSTIRFSYNGPPIEQDQPLYAFPTGHLEAGQCRTQQVQTSVWVPQEGPWFLGAVVDPGQYELEFLDTNNALASKAVGIGYRTDYTITALSGPASVLPGQPFTASVTVCNQGTVSGSTDVQLVLSEDTTIRFSYDGPPHDQDQPLVSFPSGHLEAGQCTTQQLQVQPWVASDGLWYLGAVADASGSELELIETNNTRASAAVGIGHRTDYAITAVSGPASVRPGDPFTASVTVCNQGTVSGGTEVQLVLSQDTTIRFSYGGPPQDQDQPLQSFFTGPLEPGQCTTQQVQSSAHPPQHGAWHLGAVADPSGSEQEFLETNNTRASVAVGIGYSADLVIRELTAPASVAFGQPYPVTVKVCNQGTEASFAEVQLVLSEDATIHFSYNGPPGGQDMPVEYLSFSDLQPGQCAQQTLSLSMPPPQPGTWHVGAVADPGLSLPELIETNNTRASASISFQP